MQWLRGPLGGMTCLRFCRDSMTQLLQGSGAGASTPYMFLPGNHEVCAQVPPCHNPSAAMREQRPVLLPRFIAVATMRKTCWGGVLDVGIINPC